jgi:hypothetical protein
MLYNLKLVKRSSGGEAGGSTEGVAGAAAPKKKRVAKTLNNEELKLLDNVYSGIVLLLYVLS